MKINEKNLCAFASSATPVDREGWLDMRAEVGKSYQRRWFTLKGNLLFYFDKKGEKEPTGVIVLEGCTIELTEEEEAYSFKIVFQCEGGRTFYLCTNSQASMEAWMKALACASYDYMKLMVAELQRQLDEAEAEAAAEAAAPAGAQEPRAPPRAQRHNPFNRAPDAQPEPRAVPGSRHRESEHTHLIAAEAAAEVAAPAGAQEPRAPPRAQRHNPFNRAPDAQPEPRAVPGSRHHKENLRPAELPRKKVPFRDIHTSFGRRVLAHRSEWRAQRARQDAARQRPAPADAPLIQL